MRDEGVIYVASHPLLSRRCAGLPGCIRLRNDLYCVEWGVKLYSLMGAVHFSKLVVEVQLSEGIFRGKCGITGSLFPAGSNPQQPSRVMLMTHWTCSKKARWRLSTEGAGLTVQTKSAPKI